MITNLDNGTNNYHGYNYMIKDIQDYFDFLIGFHPSKSQIKVFSGFMDRETTEYPIVFTVNDCEYRYDETGIYLKKEHDGYVKMSKYD